MHFVIASIPNIPYLMAVLTATISWRLSYPQMRSCPGWYGQRSIDRNGLNGAEENLSHTSKNSFGVHCAENIFCQTATVKNIVCHVRWEQNAKGMQEQRGIDIGAARDKSQRLGLLKPVQIKGFRSRFFCRWITGHLANKRFPKREKHGERSREHDSTTTTQGHALGWQTKGL